MARVSKETLKSYFELGDVPTQNEFADLIDSLALQENLETLEGEAGDLASDINDLEGMIHAVVTKLGGSIRRVDVDMIDGYYLSNAESPSLVENGNYQITRPIQLSAGETVVLRCNQGGVSAIAITNASASVFTRVVSGSSSKKVYMYTATEDIYVSLCGQKSLFQFAVVTLNVVEKLTELESLIGLDFFVNKAMALRTTGLVSATSEGIDTTDFLPITGQTPIQFFGGWTSLDYQIVPLAFYDELRNFISYKTGKNGENLVIPVEDIPSNAKYIRCCAYTGGYTPVIYGVTLGSIWGRVANALTSKYFLPNGTNLNNIIQGGIYMLDSSFSYENSPLSTAFLIVTSVSSFTLQVIYSYTGNKVLKRRGSSNGRTWEEWQQISKDNHSVMEIKGVLTSSDLNTIGENATFLLADSYQYENAPYDNAIGFLRVTTTGNFTLQEFYPFSGNKLFKRRGSISSNTWTEWGEISGTGVIQNITNEYNYPNYNVTYDINVTPEITTSSNNFLSAKTDGSDRTAEIVAMLQSTGICRLGSGTYVVRDLIMPDNSMIIGSGASTKVLLADDGNFAIKMTDYCSVKDLSIMGSESNISVSENLQERHGILWQGDFAQTEIYANQPYMGHIDNVWISRFAGGGITCYNTGYGTSNMLEVVNVSINNCSAGINISYWSEFHKFTNVRCTSCYYGCINNGGNNIFVNCDFSSSTGIAFLMDNSQNQSPNNSHGSAIGCVFNHTASNTGIGIKILNNDVGFVFDGCQIFYSQIYIEESNGVMFTSCNFGQNNSDITIKGGAAILFVNNLFGGTPIITKTNNTTTRFINCLIRNTGAEIVA